ncbi:hypothetical protein PI126_g9610 [Phytophthora idaei]|nr:hypothetical protein PI126_g9610 [Phytophthora idaei]
MQVYFYCPTLWTRANPCGLTHGQLCWRKAKRCGPGRQFCNRLLKRFVSQSSDVVIPPAGPILALPTVGRMTAPVVIVVGSAMAPLRLGFVSITNCGGCGHGYGSGSGIGDDNGHGNERECDGDCGSDNKAVAQSWNSDLGFGFGDCDPSGIVHGRDE